MNKRIHSVLRWIYRRIPGSVRRISKLVFLRQKFHHTPVYGLWRLQQGSEVTKATKRALLSYITLPFRLRANDPLNIQFSNIGIARSIVCVLNELGYIVDVVEYTDTKFIPCRNYHLFIGHGAYNFEGITSKLWPDTVKIYFSAGSYWKFNNEQEMARIAAMRARRGIDYPYERLDISEEWACSNADVIIALGNDFIRETYGKFPHVITLNNAAYYDNHYEQQRKDFASAKRNFLFFSGGGNVHKGLDILLEAFVQADAHLYICQDINPDFYKAYKHELKNFPNVHLIEWVAMRSPQFYEIVDKCGFLIYPSCADGSPGAVVECMHQGLIPVLSRETGIGTGDYGITLDTCSIDEIVKLVRDLSRRPPRWCEQMSQGTRKVAVTEFSKTAFLGNMKNAIQAVIKRRT